MSFRPERLTYDQIREEAETFLDEYHRDRIPAVPIEAIVEFDLNIDVRPVTGLKSDLGVDAFLTNNLEWIYCDEWVILWAPERYRFSLAHELGHWWLHDELYETSRIHSVADFKRVVELISVDDYRLFESQANNFAGLILAPKAPLGDIFRQVRAKVIAAGVHSDQVERHPARAFVINEIAKRFEVSESVIEIRLERDGLLPRLPIAADFDTGR